MVLGAEKAKFIVKYRVKQFESKIPQSLRTHTHATKAREEMIEYQNKTKLSNYLEGTQTIFYF